MITWFIKKTLTKAASAIIVVFVTRAIENALDNRSKKRS